MAELLSRHLSNSWPKLEVRLNLPGRGRGIFLTKAAKKREVLASYKGELISEELHKKRQNKRNPARRQLANSYRVILQGRGKVIEAHRESDHFGRLLNHSRRHSNVKLIPTELRTADGATRRVPLFVATRNIEASKKEFNKFNLKSQNKVVPIMNILLVKKKTEYPY